MIDGSEIRKRELAFELQSSRVFEKPVKAATCLSKSTVNEPFPLRICFDAIKFVLPSVLTPKRRLAQEFVQNHGRRVQKVHCWLACVGFSSLQSCTVKSYMYIFVFFSCHICRTTVC